VIVYPGESPPGSSGVRGILGPLLEMRSSEMRNAVVTWVILAACSGMTCSGIAWAQGSVATGPGGVIVLPAPDPKWSIRQITVGLDLR
jgi:hypothetical protein